MSEEEKQKLNEDYLLGYVRDIAKIVDLKECLKDCAENDHYFEICGDSAKVLWEYISALETVILLGE